MAWTEMLALIMFWYASKYIASIVSLNSPKFFQLFQIQNKTPIKELIL